MEELFCKEIENYIINDDEIALKNSIKSKERKEFEEISLFLKLKSIIQNDEPITPEIKEEVSKYEKKDYQKYEFFTILIERYLLKSNKLSDTELVDLFKKRFATPFTTSDFRMPNIIRKKDDVLESRTTYPSELTDSDLELPVESLIENLLKDDKDKVNKIKDVYPHILSLYYDFTKLNDSDFKHVFVHDRINMLSSFDYSKQSIEFFTRLCKSYDEESKSASTSVIESLMSNLNIISNLITNKQLEFMINNIKSNKLTKDALINNLLSNQFYSRLINSEISLLEKRKILFEIREFLKDKPLSYDSLRLQILLQILNNGISINEYDMTLFEEYIKFPLFLSPIFTVTDHNILKKIKNNSKSSFEISGLASIYDADSILNSYIKYFFQFKDDHEEFYKKMAKIFNNKHLEILYYNCCLLRGVDNLDYIKVLGRNAYSSECKRVSIDICSFNKKKFEIDEPIKLTVDIKNITTLNVQIFEINTENYYLKTRSAITSDINLEGLESTYNQTFCYNEASSKLNRRDFVFDKIPNKRGIYVIELVGGGYSSRAMIQKGALTIINKDTSKGTLFFILNEKTEICKDEKNISTDNKISSKSSHTGIWIKDTFYPSINNEGAILLPYFDSNREENAVIVHDNFAEISQISLKRECYLLFGNLIYNHESFIAGNTSKILFTPEIKLNNTLIDPSLAKNIRANLTLLKKEQNDSIPIINVYSSLSFSKNKDLVFEFQVPLKLQSIRLVINCDIRNQSENKDVSLIYTKEIPINNLGEATNYSNINLAENKDGYYLSLVGKNGEPKSGIDLSLNLKSKYLNKKNTLKDVTTNDKGEVFLGKLKNIDFLKVNYTYLDRRQEKDFLLERKQEISINKNIVITENFEFDIPIGMSNINLKDYSLYRLNPLNDMKIEDIMTDESKFSLIKLTEREITENTKASLVFKFKNLVEGFYRLINNIYPSEVISEIRVIKGNIWNNNFIKAEDKIIELSQNLTPVKINNLSYDLENSKVRVILGNVNKNTRAHLLGFSYLPSILAYNSKNIMINNETNFELNRKSFYYSNWENFYLSNRLLNEELKYVLERKDLERFPGNSLDKPSLLMKRQFIRDTTTEIQEAKEGTQYQKKAARMCKVAVDQEKMDYKCKKIAKKECRSLSQKEYCFSYNSLKKSLLDRMNSNCVSISDYISLSPIIIENLVPNDKGEIEITVKDLKLYNTLQVIAIDEASVADESINVNINNTYKNNENNKLPFKDLSLQNNLNPNKPYCENRNIYLLKENESFAIKDITSSIYKEIDSIENYLSYVALVSNSTLQIFNKQKLNMLTRFEFFTLEEKLKFVSDNFSHEINVFFYFKYNEFFRDYIKPIIKLKSEKTFIDFALLHDIERIRNFLNPNSVKCLNPLEQCLLVYTMRDFEFDFCKNLVNSLENSEENKPIEKKFFTTIMNMKTSSDKEEELKGLAVDGSRMEKMNMNLNLGSCSGGMASNFSCLTKGMNNNTSFGRSRKAHDQDLFALEDVINEEYVQELHKRKNLFKETGKSKEYRETHYLNSNQIPMFEFSRFWIDLAKYFINKKDVEEKENKNGYNAHYITKNFITNGILDPVNNISNLTFKLAFLDLPRNSVVHEYKRLENMGLEIKAKTNIILFVKNISQSEYETKKSLMINYKITRVNKSKDSKTIEETYITNEIYKMETIITNISSKPLKFELLIQIPQGAIPVENCEYTSTSSFVLPNFKTSTKITYFYFPKEGKFSHYPPSANVDEKVISQAQVKEVIVEKILPKCTNTDFSSIDDVLESGTKKEILEFIIKLKVIEETTIVKVSWLLLEKDFCLELFKELKKRNQYSRLVWDVMKSNYHNVEALLDDYYFSGIYMKDGKLSDIYTEKKIYSEIIEDANYTSSKIHYDYHPIINSRVHGIGSRDNVKIRNIEFKNTYKCFISYLFTLMRKPNSFEKLRIVYYLILQDRIEEALLVFSKIDTNEFTKINSWLIQYDYIRAYLDFSSGETDFKVAKEICQLYRNFPLDYWKSLFEEIEDQLMEYEGKDNFEGVEDLLIKLNKDKNSNTSKIAALEESKTSLSLQGSTINLVYYNTSSVVFKYYLIDIESLFSVSPFIKQDSQKFSYVKPSLVKNVELNKALKEQTISLEIPEELINSNLFIELNNNEKKTYETYFSSSLSVIVSELFGELKVLSKENKPLSKTYVKCFARLKDNSIKFYKDGYTDLRGKFNYISLNTDMLNSVSKFSILIIHDKLGSAIKEVNPPSDIDFNNAKLEQYGKENNIEGVFSNNMTNQYDKVRNMQQQAKRAYKWTKK